MHPGDCPAWEYTEVPGHADVLAVRAASIIAGLRRAQIDSADASTDTRGVHAELFEGLTPPGHSYFAGHYRGEAFRCLKHYEVKVPGDPRVGFQSSSVGMSMGELADTVQQGLAALDAGDALPEAQLPKTDRVLYAVAFACRVLERLLQIHPYANGNGHAARFVVWAILGRYGYWPYRWTIEPRPGHPGYTELIRRHRDGDREPLEAFILECLAP